MVVQETHKKKFAKKLGALTSFVLPRKSHAKLLFYWKIGHRLNLKNPKTYNEKISWYKLYYLPHNELAISCTDKYLARKYLESKGLGEYLNRILGDWKDARDIDFDKLPNQFVLKCTHGCKYNIIVNDKEKMNKKKAIKQLNKWLREDWGVYNCEPHYTKGHHFARIICEEFLGGEIVDYKFFCFDGVVSHMYIKSGKTLTFLDKEGAMAPFKLKNYPTNSNCVPPEKFEKMKELSELLAKDFPVVRVDWFEIDGKIYFSELTFSPSAGLEKYQPARFDLEIGGLMSIPCTKK